MTTAYLFISYRSIEQDVALKLARDLLHAGYPVWLDRLHGILPGDDWRHSLEQGVTRSAALVACLSRNYVDSTWCRRELQRADQLKKPIIPALIGPVPDEQWPMEIQDKQYADFQHWTDPAAYQTALTTLLAGLEKTGWLQPGSPRAAPALEEPDPARDDPEDTAGREIQQAAMLERKGGLAAVLAGELRKDMDLALKQYVAVAQQYRVMLDEGLRVKLEAQLQLYKNELARLESELRKLKV